MLRPNPKLIKFSGDAMNYYHPEFGYLWERDRSERRSIDNDIDVSDEDEWWNPEHWVREHAVLIELHNAPMNMGGLSHHHPDSPERQIANAAPPSTASTSEARPANSTLGPWLERIPFEIAKVVYKHMIPRRAHLLVEDKCPEYQRGLDEVIPGFGSIWQGFHGRKCEEGKTTGNHPTGLPIIANINQEVQKFFVEESNGALVETIVVQRQERRRNRYTSDRLWIQKDHDTVIINSQFLAIYELPLLAGQPIEGPVLEYHERYELCRYSDEFLYGLVMHQKVDFAIMSTVLLEAPDLKWFDYLLTGLSSVQLVLATVCLNMSTEEAAMSSTFGNDLSIVIVPVKGDSEYLRYLYQDHKTFGGRVTSDSTSHYDGNIILKHGVHLNAAEALFQLHGFPSTFQEYRRAWGLVGDRISGDVDHKLILSMAAREDNEDKYKRLSAIPAGSEPSAQDRIKCIRSRLPAFEPVIAVHRCRKGLVVQELPGPADSEDIASSTYSDFV